MTRRGSLGGAECHRRHGQGSAAQLSGNAGYLSTCGDSPKLPSLRNKTDSGLRKAVKRESGKKKQRKTRMESRREKVRLDTENDT